MAPVTLVPLMDCPLLTHSVLPAMIIAANALVLEQNNAKLAILAPTYTLKIANV